MMIQPINFYDAKRNKRQRSGHEGPRETNGRKQRTAAVEQHLVYFVRIDGNPLLKIGRSRNFVERIKTYEESSGGTARCEAQLITKTLAESVALENHVIGYLKDRYPQSRREWFDVPIEDMADIVSGIVTTSPVPIIRQNGDPAAAEPKATIAEAVSHEVRSAARQYAAARTRVRL